MISLELMIQLIATTISFVGLLVVLVRYQKRNVRDLLNEKMEVYSMIRNLDQKIMLLEQRVLLMENNIMSDINELKREICKINEKLSKHLEEHK